MGGLLCLAGPACIYWHQQLAKQLATGHRSNLTFSVFPAARDAGTDAKLCQKDPSPRQCPAPAGPHTSSPEHAGQCPDLSGKLGNGSYQMWAASGAGIGHSQSRLAECASSEGSKQARQQVSLIDALGHLE